jgi:sugar O-acyltransferase (sialic acid O-acetyltransferase NeuD family)
MTQLLIVGAGGHARVVADAALTTGAWQRVCFVDDSPAATGSLGLPIVGTSTQLQQLRTEFSAAVVGIGDARTRLQLLDRCRSAGFELPPIVHRTAAVSTYATLGPGVVVFAQAAINPGATLDAGCIVNTGATVDHDCHLESGVHVCPGAHLAGNVRVAARTWIGIGACVKHGVRIGADVVVGAGAAVVADIQTGLTVTGVPARPRAQAEVK